MKIDIVREYASAYSRIMAAQPTPLRHIYIDGFSGVGAYVAKATREIVWGSPTSVLFVEPPFKEYHLIDLDRGSIEAIRSLMDDGTVDASRRDTVRLYNADCNDVLLTEVFPRVKYEDYCRGLCLLDPYGLHLDWEVIKTAGAMGTIELFLNFPIMDINMNALHRDPSSVDPAQKARLTRYWGDESWRDAAYSGSGDLFGHEAKLRNEDVAQAFRDRLRTSAGFEHVPDPMPMRNTKGAVVYYLVFAAHRPVSEKIVKQIFEKHRHRRA